MAALQPATSVKAFVRIAQFISDEWSMREIVVIRALLAMLILRLAVHLDARIPTEDVHRLISDLAGAETGHDLRLAYERCIFAIAAATTHASAKQMWTADKRITVDWRRRCLS